MMFGGMLLFFAFVDLGIGNGLLAKLTKSHANKSAKETVGILLAGYVCSTLVVLLLLGIWITAVLMAENPLRFLGKISEENLHEATVGFSVLVLLIGSNIILQPGQKCQLAYQEGHLVGLSQSVSQLITAVALTIALTQRLSIAYLVLCTVGVQAIVTLISTTIWLRRRNLLRLLFKTPLQLEMMKSILRTGLQFFAIQLCGAFAFQSDAIVIGNVLGQAEYGDYAAIQRVFLAATGLIGAGLLGMWPAFGQAIVRGEMDWVRRVYISALKLSFLVVGAGCLIITVGMPEISTGWLGMENPPNFLLPVVLSLWAVTDILGQTTATLLNGAGLVAAQMAAAFAMAATAFAAKWYLVSTLGVEGAVLATILAYWLISVPVQYRLVRGLLFKAHQS